MEQASFSSTGMSAQARKRSLDIIGISERSYGKAENNFQIESQLWSTGLTGDQDEERGVPFKLHLLLCHGSDPSEDNRIGNK